MTSTQSVGTRNASHLVVASLFFMAVASLTACQRSQDKATGQPNISSSASPSPSPVQQATPIAAKYYQGSGVVTKVVRENPYDKSLASVEMDHGEIVGLMPPMRMEFYVKHVSMLDGLKIGDVVDFTIEEKGGTEIISELKKK